MRIAEHVENARIRLVGGQSENRDGLVIASRKRQIATRLENAVVVEFAFLLGDAFPLGSCSRPWPACSSGSVSGCWNCCRRHSRQSLPLEPLPPPPMPPPADPPKILRLEEPPPRLAAGAERVQLPMVPPRARIPGKAAVLERIELSSHGALKTNVSRQRSIPCRIEKGRQKSAESRIEPPSPSKQLKHWRRLSEKFVKPQGRNTSWSIRRRQPD